MGDEVRIIPIDLENGKYVIEIPADSDVDPKYVAEGLNKWIESDAGFIILAPGLKLTRIDADDIQEET